MGAALANRGVGKRGRDGGGSPAVSERTTRSGNHSPGPQKARAARGRTCWGSSSGARDVGSLEDGKRAAGGEETGPDPGPPHPSGDASAAPRRVLAPGAAPAQPSTPAGASPAPGRKPPTRVGSGLPGATGLQVPVFSRSLPRCPAHLWPAGGAERRVVLGPKAPPPRQPLPSSVTRWPETQGHCWGTPKHRVSLSVEGPEKTGGGDKE